MNHWNYSIKFEHLLKAHFREQDSAYSPCKCTGSSELGPVCSSWDSDTVDYISQWSWVWFPDDYQVFCCCCCCYLCFSHIIFVSHHPECNKIFSVVLGEEGDERQCKNDHFKIHILSYTILYFQWIDSLIEKTADTQ